MPVGIHMVTQWGVADPTALLGVGFTDAARFWLGLPRPSAVDGPARAGWLKH